MDDTRLAVAVAIRKVRDRVRWKPGMETAFPPNDIDGYLTQPGFAGIGTVEELLA